jgi:lysylphosphatidylglycerol synthetase-like protein (DUF2156 family)
MKLPNSALPLVIIAFVTVRIFVAVRIGKAERERTGKSWIESIPKWVIAFWVLLGTAVIVLLFLNPRAPRPSHSNPPMDPASVSLHP